MTIVMFTGILISQAALPALGLALARSPVWTGLHRWSADLSLYLFALHVAVHWKWILSAFQRFVLNPFHRPAASRQPLSSEPQS